uniref:Secreted protein n=1 Tax=Ixodes ricinus TaxID=34613 RepID=A0A6B0UDR4_IXORI
MRRVRGCRIFFFFFFFATRQVINQEGTASTRTKHSRGDYKQEGGYFTVTSTIGDVRDRKRRCNRPSTVVLRLIDHLLSYPGVGEGAGIGVPRATRARLFCIKDSK